MMDNKEDNSLFDMYGIEKEEVVETTPEIPKKEEVKEEVVETTPEIPIKEEQKEEIEEKNIDNKNDNNNKAELLKLYIGPNYEGFINGGYSYSTLIFGLYYMFYRKKYNYFAILLIIQLAALLSYDFLLQDLYYIFVLIYFVICLFIGIKFKREYVEEAQNKIDEICSKNISEEEKKDLIKKTGGTDKKVFILFILITIVSYALSTVTMKFFDKKPDIFIHAPEEFKSNVTSSSKSYNIGNYDYSDTIINFRTNDNVCNYKFVTNNEYINSDNKKLAIKYLKSKHDLDATVEEEKYGNFKYYHYYDEVSKNDYYFLITKRTMTEINVSYIKDQNKKCREYTKYILEHIEKTN